MERRRELLLLARKERHKWVEADTCAETFAEVGEKRREGEEGNEAVPLLATLDFLKRFSGEPHAPATATETRPNGQQRGGSGGGDGGSGGGPLKQPLTYARFLERMKRPSSADVVKTIKAFVDATTRDARDQSTWARDAGADAGADGDADAGADADADAQRDGSDIIGAARSTDARRVRAFLNRLEHMLRMHPEWGAAPLPSSSRRLNGGSGPAGVRSFGDLTEREQREWAAERENSREGLEKLLMSKIYTESFARQGDAARDARLRRKCAALAAFVRTQHLDLPAETAAPAFAAEWQHAGEELRRMTTYFAPRDKMVCALQCCRLLSNLLTAAAHQRGEDARPGADEFLPALIYAVIRANPPKLFSNLRYIAAYRNPDKLVSEPGTWQNFYKTYSPPFLPAQCRQGGLLICLRHALWH